MSLKARGDPDTIRWLRRICRSSVFLLELLLPYAACVSLWTGYGFSLCYSGLALVNHGGFTGTCLVCPINPTASNGPQGSDTVTHTVQTQRPMWLRNMPFLGLWPIAWVVAPAQALRACWKEGALPLPHGCSLSPHHFPLPGWPSAFPQIPFTSHLRSREGTMDRTGESCSLGIPLARILQCPAFLARSCLLGL